MKKYFSIILMAVLFIGCFDSDEATVVEETKTSAESAKSLEYSLKTLDGKLLDFELVNNVLLSDELNGKIVLFNFWATWCPPCRKEMPAFVELQKKYKDRLVIVGVLMEKNKSKIELENFLNEYKVNFPITISENENFRFAKDIANVQNLLQT
eukprot:Anaeramoba_flamelloidesa862954_14.p1 GENE.a862954_14~~a862954_14.p1  ORF type:complete len:153 (-),score=11.79 a862954_14:8-466(-)